MKKINKINKIKLSLIAFAMPFWVSAAEETTTKDTGINISKFFENIISTLTGTIATPLAVIAVIILGIGAMFGYFDMRKAGMIILGIVLIFSAAWIVDRVKGNEVTTSNYELIVSPYV